MLQTQIAYSCTSTEQIFELNFFKVLNYSLCQCSTLNLVDILSAGSTSLSS